MNEKAHHRSHNFLFPLSSALLNPKEEYLYYMVIGFEKIFQLFKPYKNTAVPNHSPKQTRSKLMKKCINYAITLPRHNGVYRLKCVSNGMFYAEL